MTTLTTRFDATAAPEQEVALDLVKRAALVAPALLLVALAGWGVDGVASGALAIALVVVNFLLAAAMLTYAGRISLALLMVATLFGYVLRLGILTVAVLAVRNQPWIELLPFGLTLIVTHLGLLLWETRYVSASLAFPGLKPVGATLGSTKEQ